MFVILSVHLTRQDTNETKKVILEKLLFYLYILRGLSPFSPIVCWTSKKNANFNWLNFRVGLPFPLWEGSRNCYPFRKYEIPEIENGARIGNCIRVLRQFLSELERRAADTSSCLLSEFRTRKHIQERKVMGNIPYLAFATNCNSLDHHIVTTLGV